MHFLIRLTILVGSAICLIACADNSPMFPEHIQEHPLEISVLDVERNGNQNLYRRQGRELPVRILR